MNLLLIALLLLGFAMLITFGILWKLILVILILFGVWFGIKWLMSRMGGG